MLILTHQHVKLIEQRGEKKCNLCSHNLTKISQKFHTLQYVNAKTYDSSLILSYI